MSTRRFFTPNRVGPLAILVVLALIIAGAAWWMIGYTNQSVVTAYFNRAIGIYEGSQVRILGVKVGKVSEVTPEGDRVKVVLRVAGDVKLPADVRAVQIVPSIIADRYVQLTPAFSPGAQQAPDTITLGLDKTLEPVEVDQLYSSINELTKALGPQGANKPGANGTPGAVSQAIDTGARTLAGNGAALGTTIDKLSAAARTLSESSGNLVDTVKNLNAFVTMLAENDKQVRTFNTQLASFNQFMSTERDNLSQTLNKLSLALGDVATFVDNNRDKLGARVNELLTTTKTLADTKTQQREIFAQLPLVLSNLLNAYDAESGALQMRVDLPDLQDLLGAQCRFLNLGLLKPGDPTFEALGKSMRPLQQACETVAKQVKAGAQTPLLPDLPLGIMSGEKQQKSGPVPGTVPGTPQPGLGTGGN